MAIEYAYSFSENVFYVGLGMLRFCFWLVPIALLYSYHKRRGSLQKLFWALCAALVLFYWEYDSLNSRFGVIQYDASGVTLKQKNGQQVLLAPKHIQRFWSVSIGRSGGWACYLRVKAEGRRYESFIVDKRQHLCESDAKLLNAYYGKR